jgi:hypothetical protein
MYAATGAGTGGSVSPRAASRAVGEFMRYRRPAPESAA